MLLQGNTLAGEAQAWGSAFVIAAVFEIKRLADQPSEMDHH
jgi:hypothetical protein